MSILLSAGSNARGQLANGSKDDSHEFQPCSFSGCPPGQLPPHTYRVIDIQSGANHTLVLLETRDTSGDVHAQLWGCGDGTAGQLGIAYQRDVQAGEASTVFRPIDLALEKQGLSSYGVKLISASWETTYIALSCEGKADVLISMGSDEFGDLGIGRPKDLKGKGKQTQSFHVVSFEAIKVDGMSIQPGSISIRSLSSGQHHIIALLQATLSDGSARALNLGWGTSRHGQLRQTSLANGQATRFFVIPTLVSVEDPQDPIVSTALGNQHSVFLHGSGKLSFEGSNHKRQLQGAADVRGARKLGCTWNGTYVLKFTEDDHGCAQVLCTGTHSHGQLGRRVDEFSGPTSMAPVEFPFSFTASRCAVDLACGSEHVLVLLSVKEGGTERNEVWGWGWNEHGNLGIGSTDDVLAPVRIWPKDSNAGVGPQKAVGIWAGSGTSWIYAGDN